MTTSAMVRVEKIAKVFPGPDGNPRGIQDLSFAIAPGEILTVFGPNGAGKSTLLNLIAGLTRPDSGTVSSECGDLAKIPKCYVWQNYRDALLPWKTVAENIAFPLKLAGVPRARRHEKARELLRHFDVPIDPDGWVYHLSGGQQQMVSILRGLIVEPKIMLLDEPFSALDYQMNLTLQEKLQRIWKETGLTVVFVSHDLDQAILLADRLLLLSPGPCRQLGLYTNPLPRERSLDSLASPEHIAIKRQVLELFPRARA